MATNPRADRASQESTARRRRTTDDAGLDLKLDIPPAIKAAHPDRVFRWANDTGARIHNLTVMDDWDKVEGIEPRHVGTDQHGKPVLAHLLMKAKSFQDEDDARKEARRRDVERAQVEGTSRSREDDVPEEYRYVPKGNRIGGVS